ncbi:5-oxoprolinase subunit C family protein [Roseobacter sinensis]|uniref:Biotin-dependent carboxyltransferase family protein n=1 Tax=Roseobacter sinensis TaxID=2931391 RepID=A0ABT3BCR4_9RHOB|nr:biotin-dependent carboxyltransferase family protein [Roseobacter sp. WL0113]MCV3271365.1 biotin-dependent carboxyltransferase family protein [Roseobacter sp. WL0113]
MSGTLHVINAGPALSLQDRGRTGYLAKGLTRGGAVDQLALCEGAALLGQSPDCAAIEMMGMGGTFEADADTVIALTGAEMTATLDGAPLIWNASHALPAGAKLVIGGVRSGTYGYLHVAGGVDTALEMGARSAHLTAGIGAVLTAGDALPIPSAAARSGQHLTPDDRLSGGVIRMIPSFQSELFSPETRARFRTTQFRRDPRANRQGVRLDMPGEGFVAEGGLSIVSEIITTGDIQITGDGAPYVLMCESQTTGGYPRIGTVIPADLPKVAQAPAGVELCFELISLDAAIAIETRARAEVKALPSRIAPLVRDPHDIADLLGYQLVSGAVSATADPFATKGEQP